MSQIRNCFLMEHWTTLPVSWILLFGPRISRMTSSSMNWPRKPLKSLFGIRTMARPTTTSVSVGQSVSGCYVTFHFHCLIPWFIFCVLQMIWIVVHMYYFALVLYVPFVYSTLHYVTLLSPDHSSLATTFGETDTVYMLNHYVEATM